jgi:hypothetical protein
MKDSFHDLILKTRPSSPKPGFPDGFTGISPKKDLGFTHRSPVDDFSESHQDFSLF